MTTKLVARVPGKVILCGEHAVVFGHRAISLGISSYLTTTLSDNDNLSLASPWCIEMAFPKLSAMKMLIQKDMYQLIFDKAKALSFSKTTVLSDVVALTTSSGGEVESLLLESCNNLSTIQMVFAKVFLYLLCGITRGQNLTEVAPSGFSCNIAGDLPIGGGLGSSAAICVGLSAVLVAYSTTSKQLSDQLLADVNTWAFQAEQFIHGRASGVDNYTVCYGGIIEVTGPGQFVACPYSPTGFVGRCSLLLIDTNKPKSTKEAVAKVAKFVDEFPTVADNLFNVIDSIALNIKKLFVTETATVSSMRRLLSINQAILRALGVSHSSIDEICLICESFNFDAKLTGGGGGGYVITFIDENTDFVDVIDALVEALAKRGFACRRFSICFSGLELISTC